MMDLLLNFIHSSNRVVLATVRENRAVVVDGSDYQRVRAEQIELFKGTPSSTRELMIDVYTAGVDSPEARVGESYVFLLRSAAPVAAPWRLVNLTRPLKLPTEQRAAFLQCMREAVRVASTPPQEADLKKYMFEMLKSNVPLFLEDANAVAGTITKWQLGEIESLIAILARDPEHLKYRGDTRDNLVAVIAWHGSAAQAAGFGRAELKRDGSTEAFYAGLVNRTDHAPETVVTELLRDSNPSLQARALRLAGLLRRRDIIDAFEKQIANSADDLIRGAIASARALVTRDY